MHVLIIPSWYPNDPYDFNGSFFREQALALKSAGNRVGVLAVRAIPIYATKARRARRRQIDVEDDDGVLTVRADVVLPVPRGHALNYARHFQVLQRAFSEYCARYGRPDVLHAHTVFPAGVLTHRLSAAAEIPFIITEHRPSSLDRLKNGWNRRHGTTAVRAADRRVAVARAFAPQLEDAYRAPDAPWEYFPGLLSPQLEAASIRKQPEQPPFIFGHVSHLDYNKRADLLIEAFADRFGDDSTAVLRIAGHGPESSKLQALATSRGIEDRVQFEGAIPRDAIAAEFSAAHVFVLPSSTEAFGTVIWEAMATGLPIVASRTWAGQNAVSDKVGILFDVDDRAQLGDALVTIRSTFGGYDSGRIRALCIEHCGEEAFTRLYMQAYARAIRNSIKLRKSRRGFEPR